MALRAAAFALILLVAAGCATQPPPAPAASEPAPPAPPPPAADPDPPAESPASPPRENVVETRTETRTYSVTLPDDLETDIPCSATGTEQFMGALLVRVRNRLELPRGYRAVTPGSPATATVKVLIEVPASGEPLGAKLSETSGVEALDRAVLAAVDQARCMPPPPAKLIDSTRTFRITEPFGFERTN